MKVSYETAGTFPVINLTANSNDDKGILKFFTSLKQKHRTVITVENDILSISFDEYLTKKNLIRVFKFEFQGEYMMPDNVTTLLKVYTREIVVGMETLLYVLEGNGKFKLFRWDGTDNVLNLIDIVQKKTELHTALQNDLGN